MAKVHPNAPNTVAIITAKWLIATDIRFANHRASDDRTDGGYQWFNFVNKKFNLFLRDHIFIGSKKSTGPTVLEKYYLSTLISVPIPHYQGEPAFVNRGFELDKPEKGRSHVQFEFVAKGCSPQDAALLYAELCKSL